MNGKKTIEELLDEATVEETEELMKSFEEEPIDAGRLARIQARVLEKTGHAEKKEEKENAEEKSDRPPLLRVRRLWIAATAAAFILILTAVLLPALLKKEETVTTPAGEAESIVKQNGMIFVLSPDGQGYDLMDVDESAGGNVTVPETVGGIPVTGVLENAFLNSSANSVDLPASVSNFSAAVFNNSLQLSAVVFSSKNSKYTNADMNVTMNKTTLLLGVDGSVPTGVVTIGEEAFSGRTTLTSVTLPKGLQCIQTRAFSGCTSLSAIELPDGLLYLGSGAFEDCTSLTSVTIPSSLLSVGRDVFAGCTSLETVYFTSADDKMIASVNDNEWQAFLSLLSENDRAILENAQIIFKGDTNS